MLYPQNGDHIVAIVTFTHMYKCTVVTVQQWKKYVCAWMNDQTAGILEYVIVVLVVAAESDLSSENQAVWEEDLCCGVDPHLSTHTHTRLTALFPGLPGWVGTRKVKPIWIYFTGARDSDWQWHQLGHMQVCTSLYTDNHASTPPLSFLQTGCPSCRPTNSVKALKATADAYNKNIKNCVYP